MSTCPAHTKFHVRWIGTVNLYIQHTTGGGNKSFKHSKTHPSFYLSLTYNEIKTNFQ